MFKIDDSDVRHYEDKLGRLASRSIPFATKATLNTLAFKTREQWQENVRNDMINRNKFTERSILVEQAKGLNIRRQEAVTGSIAPYMDDQEFGGTKTKTGSKGVAIATSVAAGQGQGVQPRTRLPRRPNKMGNINLSHRRKNAKNRKQRNLIAVKQAQKSGNKFVFLDLGRRQGIFKVTGGKRNPRIRMIHDMSRKSVRIPKNPTMGPAVAKVLPQLPNIYGDALKFQLKRLNL